MKKKLLTWLLLVTLLVGSVLTVPAQAGAYNVSSNMEWWSNDKFGMFIHLGSYSYYGQGEWAMSEQKISKKKYQTTISANFNPVNFDADSIVEYAKAAGMKYIVITAKHHEGLAMWDTQVESFKDYTGTTMYSLQQYTAFGSTGRDILMELKNACDNAGIKFGLYYSILDWNHSSQTMSSSFTTMKSMEARASYIQDMKAQLKELVDRYDPAVMWFDGDWTRNSGKATLESWWTKKDGKDLYQYMKEISPDIIVNERVCRDFGLGDFECPEQSVPAKALDRPWETCQTMNDAWGYKKTSEKNYRSVKSIVQELATVASRNGNYLLNVGPKGDGSLTSGSIKILKGVAKWMNTNSQSIYETSGNPFSKDPSWGTYTKKGNTIYAHVFKTKKTKTIQVSRYKGKKPTKVYLVGQPDKSLKVSYKKGKILIKLSKKSLDAKDTVIAMEYSS
jgi:alpha-L-fucosidase